VYSLSEGNIATQARQETGESQKRETRQKREKRAGKTRKKEETVKKCGPLLSVCGLM
jgi:hypothetical protein